MNNINLMILYEDNHIIVCIKPPGVLSQPDGKNIPDMLTLLKEYIRAKYSKPGNVFVGLVHRLDLNVGGVMVFAKTSKAAARLSESVRLHSLKKMYYAVIDGYLPMGTSGVFEDFIAKDETMRVGYITDEFNGKASKLAYKVIENSNQSSKPLTLIEIELISGRFHQIRLQFSSRGLPLYGDTKYGNSDSKVATDLGLYAFRLEIVHPISKEMMIFEKAPHFGVFTKFNT